MHRFPLSNFLAGKPHFAQGQPYRLPRKELNMKQNSILLGALVTIAVITGVLSIIVRRRSAADRPFRGSKFPNGSRHEFGDEPSNEDIARLAQLYWEEEGHPEGRAEEHWRRAEEHLRHFSDATAAY
jgi:hypothetical protein